MLGFPELLIEASRERKAAAGIRGELGGS